MGNLPERVLILFASVVTNAFGSVILALGGGPALDFGIEPSHHPEILEVARKYADAEREWIWKYVFPAQSSSIDP